MRKSKKKEPGDTDQKSPKGNIIGKWIKSILLGNKEKIPYRLEQDKIEKMSADEAEFYLELTEKQLQDSVDTGQIITERSTNMLNLTSALLIALVAYSIDRWETYKEWDLLLKMAIWGNVFLTIASGLLVAAILPKDYCITGWTPEKIFNSRAFNEENDEDKRQRRLVANLLTNYENNIIENRNLNNKRWTLFNLSMLIILMAPICFASYYLFFR